MAGPGGAFAEGLRGRSPGGGAPEVRIRYRRGPDDVRGYRQELLHDGDRYKLTLYRVPEEAAPLTMAPGVELGAGARVFWFTYPEHGFEVAACFHAGGEPAGYYTNLVRPPSVEGRRWEIHDLGLDLWQDGEGAPARLVDRDELARGAEEGWIGEEEARRVLARGERIRRLAAAGAWPPPEVRRVAPSHLPALRFRRDLPGSYHANLASARVIAYGMYCLAAFCVTTVGFAAFTDALAGDPETGRLWLTVLGGEALVMLPLALTGRLPATRRVLPKEALTERTLFTGALVTGGAVLILNDSRLWSDLLAAVCAVLAFFLTLFAAGRAYWDRERPTLALTGLAISVAALFFLL